MKKMLKSQFIVDEKGRKKAVVLSLKEYKQLLEDLSDLALMARRRHEPAEPLEEVEKQLEALWKNIAEMSSSVRHVQRTV